MQMTKQEQMDQAWAQREAQTQKGKDKDWDRAERKMKR